MSMERWLHCAACFRGTTDESSRLARLWRFEAFPLQAAYCATKHAIVGFTDSLRCELYHDKSNVKVTVVHMPAMNTPQFTWVKSRLPELPQPVPPIYDPEVGARVVLHAALTSIAAAGVLGRRLDSESHRSAESSFPACWTYILERPDTTRSNARWRILRTVRIISGSLCLPPSVRMDHSNRRRGPSAWKQKSAKHRGWFFFGCGLVGRGALARKWLTT